MQRISDKMWQRYRNIIYDFVDLDAGLQPVTWLKHIKFPLGHGEDSKSDDNYDRVDLHALVNYNDFRIWPINKPSRSGETDDMNCAILVTQRHLIEVNELYNEQYEEYILNAQGNWTFDQTLDRFEINGVRYLAKGDTQTAQAKNYTLIFQVVLKREEYGKY